MDKSVEKCLLEMELGAGQSYENMTVFELMRPQNGGPEYITLREALAQGFLTVTEVSQGGSVPELMVVNKGDMPVLILDGEELRGAKQNRVLNTTIMIGPRSSTRVPVSCVEHGRWHSVSEEMADSGNVMHREMRALNVRRVSENLFERKSFDSDQSMIWNRITDLACEMGAPSATGAMSDVYEAKGSDLDSYLRTFRLAPGQKGIMVFIDGRPAGLDYVSRDRAFAELYTKLLKSYAMEAMLLSERRKKGRGPGEADQALVKPAADKAREFLKLAAACDEKKYESVGLGWAFRYSGPWVVGSALAYNDKVVHMAFFGLDEPRAAAEDTGNLAATGKRRRFRLI